MSRRKHGIRATGLCLMVALGLMALTGASAQAKPKFRILKNNTTETVGFEAEKDQPFVLLVKAQNIEVSCEKFNINDGLLFVEGTGLAEPEFTECVVFSMKPLELLPCAVTVTSSPVVGSLILLGKTTYALIEPDKVSVFATINFSKATCVLPEHVNITGSLVLEDCGKTNDLGEELVRHLVEQAPQELFPTDTLSYGKSEARLDGSTRLKLTAPNVNEFWSGVGG